MKFDFNIFAQIAPTIIVILSFMASFGYILFTKPINWKSALYWFCAACLNGVVTWMKG